MITGSRRRRQFGLLSVGLLGAAALAGCGSEVEGESSAASSSSSSTAGSSSPAATSAAESTGALDGAEDLSAGLLAAEAFGPGAQVTPITADQLEAQQGPVGGIAGLQDLTITPEECAPAVKSIQPGLDDVEGVAAQTATAGSTTTVEILAAGEAIAAGVEQLDSTVDRCPQATVTAPQIGTAQVSFARLDVPDLGDAAAGISMTLSVTGPGGQPVTVPLLLGMVRDGDRLVSLTQTDPTGGTDPAAFAALLQQAVEQQADALD
jgi:hypothetical protein